MKHTTFSPSGLLRKMLALCLLFSLSSTFSNAQKNGSFMGMLEYKITVRDTSMREFFPDNKMFLYTNDTIVRLENFTAQLGKQVTIRHIAKNKSYLLLDSPAGKFAIQTDLSAADSAQHVSKYSFKKKCFKQTIVGRKANRVMASHPDFEEPMEFLYFKNISERYHSTFEGMPGLPVRYSVITADGIIDYELVKISEFTPNRDLFGVPSDYERLSFDEFLNRMLKAQEDQPPIPEE